MDGMKRGTRTALALAMVIGLAGCGRAVSIPATVPARPTTPPAVADALATSQSMSAIDFENAQTGWLAGAGQIWQTTDGGRQWRVVFDQGEADFHAIRFVTPRVGWAWSNRTLVETTDGGITWRVVHQGPSPLVSFSMVSPVGGYAVWDTPSAPAGPGVPGGRLFVTTDGGRRWRALTTPFHPVAVDFSGPLDGWVVGTHHIWRTVDGGRQWHPVVNLRTPPMSATIRLTGSMVWVLLRGGSGMNQTSYTLLQYTPKAGWKTALAVSTAGAGPAPDAALGAPDGPGLVPGPLVAVDAGTAFFAGEVPAANLGTTAVWAYDDGHWNRFSAIYGANGIPGSDALSFVNARDGWLVGGSGETQVFRTRNGGKSWYQVFPAPVPVRGVSFPSATTGYGLGLPGQPNAVVKTTDGGTRWVTVGQLPASDTWQSDAPMPSIVFTGPATGWAVRDQRLWQTVDGGREWTPIFLPDWTPADGLEMIDFLDSAGIVGAPYENTSWWTVDGGATWHRAQRETVLQGLGSLNRAVTPQTLGESQEILGVGANGPVLWILGENEWALSTDNGTQWVTHAVPRNMAGGMMADLSFANAQDGWLESGLGQLYRTHDGGAQWQAVP